MAGEWLSAAPIPPVRGSAQLNQRSLMTQPPSPAPSSPRRGADRRRRRSRGPLIPLLAVLAVLVTAGTTAWFTVGPGGEAEAGNGGGEPFSLRDLTAEGGERYEELAAGAEILGAGHTHVFGNGVELTVFDPREFTPETPEVAGKLQGTALRIAIRQEDFSGQGLPLAPAAPEVAAGADLTPVERIWDSDEDMAPALSKPNGGAAFDIPAGTDFIVVEIRTPHTASGMEYAHWRIDF